MNDTSVLQHRVNSLLRIGIISSIVWLMGVGSLCAFVCGLKARSIIKASEGQVIGMGRAWWCLIVGGFGVVLWLPVLSALVFNAIVRR